jgi:hypothetical protein
MAENKQRSPGKGNRSEKQRAAQAEASFDESTASTDFGNDVKEIRSFTDDDDESTMERTGTRQQSGMREQSPREQQTRSQGMGGQSQRRESDGWADQRYSERDDQWEDQYSQGSEKRGVREMVSDRMEDLKDYAGHLVNGTFDKLKDEWKYNRKSLIRKAAIAAVVTTAGVALAVAMKNNRRSKALI